MLNFLSFTAAEVRLVQLVSTQLVLKADFTMSHQPVIVSTETSRKGNLETLATYEKGLDPQVVEALHVHGLVVEVVEVGAADPW